MKAVVGLCCALMASAMAFAEDKKFETLTYLQFEQLDPADRGDYLESLRLAAVEMESENEIQAYGIILKILIHPAYAAAGDSCIYAGYISQRTAQNICEVPVAYTQKTWTYSVGGRTMTQKLCTNSGQVLCNPLLYGFGNDGSGLCTSSKSRPTADCEAKYQAIPNYKASHVADQLVSNKMSADFDSHARNLNSYCSGSESNSQTNMCSSLSRKSSYMKAKLQASEQRQQKSSNSSANRGIETGAPIAKANPENKTPTVGSAPKTALPETGPVPQSRPASPAQKVESSKSPVKTNSREENKVSEKSGRGGDPWTANDRDLKRLRDKKVITKASSDDLEFSTETFVDGKGKSWKVRVLQAREGSDSPVFFLPHDNEDMALETAVRYIQKYGRGKIVFLDCGNQRICGGTDPNRYFCSGKGDKKFADKIFSYFKGNQPVIALHTNEDGCVDHGGAGHVSAKHPFPGSVGNYRGGDEDDIVIHNGKSSTPTGVNATLSKFLASKKYNEIYESGADDCSMSFAATERGRFYFNVESQENFSSPTGYTTQLETLDSILSARIGQAASPGGTEAPRKGNQ